MKKFTLPLLFITFIIYAFLGFAQPDYRSLLNTGLELLKFRKDDAALGNFNKILLINPNDLDALWGKAEVLRRKRNYRQAEIILNKILNKNPKHFSSLISLAHLRYKEGSLNNALSIINQVLAADCPEKENRALAYVLWGAINSQAALKSGLLGKLKYGTKIKGYFLQAERLVPDLPEAHLGLGSFYLLAPKIIGGNLYKAIEELKKAVKLAPDFATANARLAQAYKKKGDLEKYNYYIEKVKRLDPQNEVLKEIEK